MQARERKPSAGNEWRSGESIPRRSQLGRAILHRRAWLKEWGKCQKSGKARGGGKSRICHKDIYQTGLEKPFYCFFRLFFFFGRRTGVWQLEGLGAAGFVGQHSFGRRFVTRGLGSRARPDVPHGYSTNGRPVEACAVTLPRAKLSLCRVTAWD